MCRFRCYGRDGSAPGSDEKIVVAVVIVITYCDAQTEHGNVEPGFVSHICKSAVVIVVIELQGGCRTGVAGPVFSVDEHDVLPAVAIVINERTTGAQGFG